MLENKGESMPHIPLKSVVSVSFCTSDHFQSPLAERQSLCSSLCCLLSYMAPGLAPLRQGVMYPLCCLCCVQSMPSCLLANRLPIRIDYKKTNAFWLVGWLVFSLDDSCISLVSGTFSWIYWYIGSIKTWEGKLVSVYLSAHVNN